MVATVPARTHGECSGAIPRQVRVGGAGVSVVLAYSAARKDCIDLVSDGVADRRHLVAPIGVLHTFLA